MDTNTPEARLDRLERWNRVWKWSALVTLTALAAVEVQGMSARSSANAELVTRKVRIVDEAGANRIVLGANEEGLLGIKIRDANGKLRGSWAVAPEGDIRLEMTSRDETPRLSLGYGDKGVTGLEVYDPYGRVRADVCVDGYLNGQFRVWDGEERLRGSFSSIRDGRPSLVFYRPGPKAGEDGKPTMAFGVDASGDAGLELLDREGQVTWRAPQH